MSSTFSQIYIQTVFAVKYRESLISPTWEEELYKYISGIYKEKNQKLLAINGMPDHIHTLFRMDPSCCISDLTREIKKSTNEFINDHHFTRKKFYWQEGYGAFSYCNRHVENVIKYIADQKQHHKKTTFKEEYHLLLKEFDIPFKEEYIFEFFD